MQLDMIEAQLQEKKEKSNGKCKDQAGSLVIGMEIAI